MAANEIHVGDVGTTIVVTVKDGSSVVDMSGATGKFLYLKPTNGTLLTKTASFYTDGSDGKIKYTTIAGDMSIPGPWELQAYVQFGSNSWKSDVKKFTVYPNIG